MANQLPASLDIGRTRRPNKAIPLFVALGMAIAVPPAIVLLPPVQIVVLLLSLIATLFYFSKPAVSLLIVIAIRLVIDMFWYVPGGFGMNLLQLFSGAAFALTGTLFFMDIRRFENNPTFSAFMVLLVMMSIGAIRGGVNMETVDLLVRYVSPFFFLFVITGVFTSSSQQRAIVVLVTVCSLVPIAFSLYHYFDGQMYHHVVNGYNRLLGGYKNMHNHALMMMMFVSLFMFWLMYERRTGRTVVYVGLIGVVLFISYMTYVRTGMLGLFVFFGLFFVLERRWSVIIVGMIGVFALFVTDEHMVERFDDLFGLFSSSEVDTDNRALGSGRWGIWTYSLTNFAKQPGWNILLGLGLGGHWEMTQTWVSQFNARYERLDPHNDNLLMLFQWGPVGVLAYWAMMWKVVKCSWFVRKFSPSRFNRTYANYAISITVGVWVANMVSNSFVHRTTPGWTYWSLMAVVLSMYQSERRRLASGAVETATAEAAPRLLVDNSLPALAPTK